MGWSNEGEDFAFRADQYSKSDALAQFVEVTKPALKNNHWVDYTAYEYNGETFYEIHYRGVVDESELSY